VRFDQVEHIGVEVQVKNSPARSPTVTSKASARRSLVPASGDATRAPGPARCGYQHALDQRLDLAAAFLHAEEAGLEHAGIVHHQQVARLQQVDDVGELAVDDLRAVQMQQAGSAAVRQRELRNRSCGKLKSKSESEYMCGLCC
jgi:hypothetical protein